MVNSLYTRCVGGGTYVNNSVVGECDSLRWTESPHTDIVENLAITPEAAAKIEHSRMLLLSGVTVTAEHLFDIFLLSALVRLAGVLFSLLLAL